MQNVFLDTNVVIDFIMRREPFISEARAIFNMGVNRMVKLCVSSLTIANAAYICRKQFPNGSIYPVFDSLLNLVTVTAIDDNVVRRAVASRAADFEDALQYYSALAGRVDCFVTRNVRDFPFALLTVMTPRDFIQSYV